MKILVTAAGGFTGPHLMRRLADGGHDVAGIVRREAARPPTANCRIVRADLAESLVLDFRPEVIVHNAAHITADRRPAADFARSNILATQRVIDFAIGCGTKSIVFFSSISAFGRISVPIVDETTPVDSPSAYGLSKLYGEQMLREAEGEIASVSLRLPGILGPGCVGPWLAGVAQRAREGRDIEIYNATTRFNNAIHVDDLGRFVGELAVRPLSGADMITLGTTDSLPLEAVVDSIRRCTGSRSKIVDRGARTGAFAVSTAKAERDFGFTSLSIAETVGRYIEQDQARPAA